MKNMIIIAQRANRTAKERTIAERLNAFGSTREGARYEHMEELRQDALHIAPLKGLGVVGQGEGGTGARWS